MILMRDGFPSLLIPARTVLNVSLPVISFNAKASKEDQQKHSDFVTRMVQRGYTEKQVRLLSEWYSRVRKSQ